VGNGLAAIIVEPVAGNMGVVPPEPGFLETLRKLCDRTGSLLIFDEVITGFRVSRGGAQELYGVSPDLTVLGKIVGGGLPLAAYGGSADVMDAVAPAGEVFQAGTLSGNPLATAAALVVLRRLRDVHVYEQLEETGGALETGLRHENVTVQRVGSMLTVFFRQGAVRNLGDAQATDRGRYAELFHHLLARGVYIAPSPAEALFVSTAHGRGEVELTVEAAQEFLAR
jgi:glutamate-1-semialdehyde 2,1-aminomutase